VITLRPQKPDLEVRSRGKLQLIPTVHSGWRLIEAHLSREKDPSLTPEKEAVVEATSVPLTFATADKKET
jgi:hypothetical protein